MCVTVCGSNVYVDYGKKKPAAILRAGESSIIYAAEAMDALALFEAKGVQ